MDTLEEARRKLHYAQSEKTLTEILSVLAQYFKFTSLDETAGIIADLLKDRPKLEVDSELAKLMESKLTMVKRQHTILKAQAEDAALDAIVVKGDPIKMLQAILRGEMPFPEALDETAEDCICGMCPPTSKPEPQPEQVQRLKPLNGILEEELKELAATKSVDEWAKCSEQIKARRGGKFPPDWIEKVITSGLISNVATNWS